MTLEQPIETTPQTASDDASPGRSLTDLLAASDGFISRHIGPDAGEVSAMLAAVGYDSLDALCDATVPESIRLNRPLDLGPPRTEHQLLAELAAMAAKNTIKRSFIGQGYYGTITPPVIQRNILENPGWYTQYTPYQAEISQGRLEALINFQTMVADLTSLPLANASLLDEATAAAEALIMCLRIAGEDKAWFVSSSCHPQTIEVVRTRARSMGVMLVVGDEAELDLEGEVSFAGVLLQYPTSDGRIIDYRDLISRAHSHGALVAMATDLLALTLITPPGELAADVAIGSSQRFGVPMGYGGPHAAFIATHAKYARKMPGRIIGLSRDAAGKPAYRMAIQTREQHIKRDRATSNICTAQVLLAIMAGMYAVYHGPHGLKRIAQRVHGWADVLAHGLRKLGYEVESSRYFDTLRVNVVGADSVMAAIRSRDANVRKINDTTIGISVDETTDRAAILDLLSAFKERIDLDPAFDIRTLDEDVATHIEDRSSEFLTHPVFNTHHSETEMLRYITRLQSRDLSLAQSMISLGSCTMKLNGTSEMLPVTWPEFANLHPFCPIDQARGYAELFRNLEDWLCEMTGFAAVSLQPNAGSQGEYAGLLAIRAYHEAQVRQVSDLSNGSEKRSIRTICLIPTSAHGTNPASAVCAGMKVVSVNCDDHGNIDLDHLRSQVRSHRDTLAAIMITYPSTHGVFEESIREMCDIVHEGGGLVYLDGANMNAQLGLCRPADYGADVCHLNLHKTFCIPHGGGGPGMGPIGVTEALKPFLPSMETSAVRAADSQVGPIAAAPYGSPSILPISWVYIALMGASGLRQATQVAIVNANYMAARLADHFDILYRGTNGTVGHEFIIDCRSFDATAGIKIDDIAKRLMDYGFHAPTMSFPVPGTLMIEPTESETKAELDRFCEALISIRSEIRHVEAGDADRTDNVLKGAPHTTESIADDTWQHAYSREQAAYPLPYLRDYKFWPAVARIDNPWGDRNLMCTCPSVEELAE